MTHNAPTRRRVRRTRSTVVVALVIAAGALLAYQSWAASSSSATPPIVSELFTHRPYDGPHLGRDETHGKAAGVVPDGVTVFDDAYPGVSHLDPALLGALRRAATDAADDGVQFYVNSGWRSPAYQQQLLDSATSEYGSTEQAARWVATPETSPHVSGDAVDLGHSEATEWLSEHGAGYGLCQIYGNEPWHYELRPEAVDHGCPPMYADAAHDPRMQ